MFATSTGSISWPVPRYAVHKSAIAQKLSSGLPCVSCLSRHTHFSAASRMVFRVVGFAFWYSNASTHPFQAPFASKSLCKLKGPSWLHFMQRTKYRVSSPLVMAIACKVFPPQMGQGLISNSIISPPFLPTASCSVPTSTRIYPHWVSVPGR